MVCEDSAEIVCGQRPNAMSKTKRSLLDVTAVTPKQRLAIEARRNAAGIDIERFENADDLFGGDVPVLGPEKDVEVFLVYFEAVDDAVEEKGLVLKCVFEYPVIAFVEFRPVFVAKEMFKKFRAKIAGPVFANPTADGVLLAYIEARFLAFDPLENGHFLVAISIKATNFHGPGAPNRLNSRLGRHENDKRLLRAASCRLHSLRNRFYPLFRKG